MPLIQSQGLEGIREKRLGSRLLSPFWSSPRGGGFNALLLLIYFVLLTFFVKARTLRGASITLIRSGHGCLLADCLEAFN